MKHYDFPTACKSAISITQSQLSQLQGSNTSIDKDKIKLDGDHGKMQCACPGKWE